ncbi:FHA domain-containing protein [Streptomyces sp. CA-249302]|uniref:FHA domain-containing protein n=1 Tax=Streptomyces sp. CA-249302 TaxID=3240058 RepID=UPI003D8B5BFE
MQIRLTVVDPLGPPERARGRTASCDVLVTAPAGTALAAVVSALSSAVSGDGGTDRAERGRGGGGAQTERARESGGPVVLYAGAERLDDRRCTLGEPPLIDGAVLSLGAPAEPEPHPELDDAPTQLHVVAGPDAGGVHLLHGGEIRIGRSADADVPLDDPDVSRFHCAITVATDGRVAVTDLGSTNGTTLDGTRVHTRPVRLTPGALLRIGESALRVAPSGGPRARVATTPDGEGHVRVSSGGDSGNGPAGAARSDGSGSGFGGAARAESLPSGAGAGERAADGGPGRRGPDGDRGGSTPMPHARVADGSDTAARASRGATDTRGHASAEPPVVPGQGGAPRIESGGAGRSGSIPADGGDTHAGRFGVFAWETPNGDGQESASDSTPAHGTAAHGTSPGAPRGAGHPEAPEPPGPGQHKGTPLRGTDIPAGVRKRGGLSAWARRLAGGRGEQDPDERGGHDDADGPVSTAGPAPVTGPQLPDTWPDPAALLLTALGPGPRLWERGPGHPEALTVRLGTADRAAPDGTGLLPAVPVTADLREAGALGLAGPRARLSGLARAVLAQLTALHSPETLEIVLISADRARPLEERTAEWSWLGWLPHLRPGHGQDCRLLLAYDREQATARTEELLRRLEDQQAERRTGAARAGAARIPRPASAPYAGGPGSTAGGAATAAGRAAPSRPAGPADPADPARGATPGGPADSGLSGVHTSPRGAARRPSWARDDDLDDTFAGPHTVVVVDGDPGGADVRQAVARLALEGPTVGIHVVCLAETASASPASPVTETYEAACAVAPVFRECGAVALLSGDVSTALRLMRVARDGTLGAGTAEAPGSTGSTGVGGLVDRAGRAGSPGPTAPGDDARLADASSTGTGRAGSTSAAAHPRNDTTVTSRVPAAPGTAAHPAHPGDSTSRDTAAHPPHASTPTGRSTAAGPHTATASGPHPGPIAPGTVARVDAVSLPWAERFARALAPLRLDGTSAERLARVSVPLPQTARLLDELGLARATPASLMARWADAADDTESLGGRARAVLGAGPRGPVCADLAADGPHLLIEGPAGSGRTELLRAVVASLAAAERPDRLGIVLMDGRDSVSTGAGHGDGLRVCTDVPHVTTHLTANDPVRMREFAQSLSAELKRRAELLGRSDFAEWHTGRELSGRMVTQRPVSAGAGDLDSPPSSTIRLRPGAASRRTEAAPPLPRLVVIVDDLDALVSPALGSPGRPAAGSVMRALEAVAREGERLGVHLVAATGPDGRTAETEPARRSTLRVTLDAPDPSPDAPTPGRGRLTTPDTRTTPFQGGRVTGRIPRTATLRPTVVPLDWQRMGDPPTRRPVRELGNGPTDLALLASALERAAREVSASEVPSLL